MTPAAVKETPALQGAAHIAWELHRALCQSSGGLLPPRSKLRGSLRAILERFGEHDGTMETWFLYDDPAGRRPSLK